MNGVSVLITLYSQKQAADPVCPVGCNLWTSALIIPSVISFCSTKCNFTKQSEPLRVHLLRLRSGSSVYSWHPGTEMSAEGGRIQAFF